MLRRTFAALVISYISLGSVFGVSPQRTFVSTGGNDANVGRKCSLAAPCRSFETAIGVVATGGEVVALDSGGYGRFTVAKSVAVNAAPGVHAAISVFTATDGVDINTAGVDVILRGLTISGQGGNHGVYFQSGASLVVEDCTIESMSATGILIGAPGSDNDHPSKTAIIGSTFSGNQVGIVLTGGPASALVRNSAVVGSTGNGIELHGTLTGVENALTVSASTITNGGGLGVRLANAISGATVEAVISDSTISENFDDGVYMTSVFGGGTTLLTAAGNAITRNFNGLAQASVGATVIKAVLAHNTISRNRQAGVYVGVTVLSRGDNIINDNTTDIVGSMGPIGGL